MSCLRSKGIEGSFTIILRLNKTQVFKFLLHMFIQLQKLQWCSISSLCACPRLWSARFINWHLWTFMRHVSTTKHVSTHWLVIYQNKGMRKSFPNKFHWFIFGSILSQDWVRFQERRVWVIDPRKHYTGSLWIQVYLVVQVC